jgi:hypothetical protein
MLDPEELRRRLVSEGLAEEDEIQGCTPEDIAQIEAECGHALPESYLRFLRLAGRGAGQFMDDLEIYFRDVLGLTQRIRRARPEIALPPSAYVFVSRMGEAFLYFDLAEGENPAIFGWSEDAVSTRKVCETFSDFIEDELRVI